jgi:hypothetical protein
VSVRPADEVKRAKCDVIVDLEYRLKAAQEEGYQSFQPFEPSENQLSETGRFEQLPPQEVIDEL